MTVSAQRARGRRGRLSRSSEFQRVYRQGRSRANRYLVLYSFEQPADAGGDVRLGVSVGRKVGNAVVRNRIKRAVRAAFAALAPDPAGALDYVVLARPDVVELIEREGASGVQDALDELLTDGPAADARPEGQEHE